MNDKSLIILYSTAGEIEFTDVSGKVHKIPTYADFSARPTEEVLMKRVRELEAIVSVLLRDMENRKGFPKGTLGLSHLG
jgi:hypothetical protein